MKKLLLFPILAIVLFAPGCGLFDAIERERLAKEADCETIRQILSCRNTPGMSFESEDDARRKALNQKDGCIAEGTRQGARKALACLREEGSRYCRLLSIRETGLAKDLLDQCTA